MLTPLSKDLNILQQLNDFPNAIDGISASQLKEKFDEAGNEIKEYINNTLIPEVEQIQSDGDGALTIHKSSDDHDGRYYTETESDTKFVTKTDLAANRKLSESGNFTGSWHGITSPAESEPGMAATVALHTSQIAAIDVDYVRSPGYAGPTGGSATAYTATLDPPLPALVAGVCVSAKFHTTSGANPTLNVDGKGAKSLKKANGSAAVIVSGGVYTWRYDGTNFILQGEGGSGDAVAGDLLIGKTASVITGDIVGTMPNRGAISNTITSQNGEYTVPAGYHDGDGKVKATFANLIASNVRAGVNVGGVVGEVIEGGRSNNGLADAIKTSNYHKISVRGLSYSPRFITAYTPNGASHIYPTNTTWDGSYINEFIHQSTSNIWTEKVSNQGTGHDQFRRVADGFDMLIYAEEIGMPAYSNVRWSAFE